jgi:hypothetical protein
MEPSSAYLDRPYLSLIFCDVLCGHLNSLFFFVLWGSINMLNVSYVLALMLCREHVLFKRTYVTVQIKICMCLKWTLCLGYCFGNESMEGRTIQIMQQCTNPWLQDAPETKFYTVAPNICFPSVWYLLHVTLLSPWILECLVSFWKVCALLKRCTEANEDVFPRELTYISVPVV